jgi:glycosyltransferase involved in cell wall biosynthesis
MIIGVDASRATAARRTGTEAYSLHLLRALLALPTAHRFRLYFNQAPPDGLLPAGGRVERRVLSFPRLWTHLRLAAELVRQRVDVLYVPAHVLPIAFPGDAVVTVHDLGYRMFPEAHPVASRLYLEWGTRWSARRARTVIADSEATRRDLVTHYRVDPAGIVVAYPGYDESLRPVRQPEALAAVRARYGIGKDYFLTMGTLQPRKNLVRLIEAYSRLPVASRPQLVLAGKRGWLAEPILARAEEPGVVVPGFVAEEDKAALLSGATAFLFPSLYEGFGFPALEAMACRTPVICSNTSSLPEVAGEAALLVDPLETTAWTDAMVRIQREQALRAELVERGAARVKRFSWGRCAEMVMAAIEGAA